ncbi:uncharacterized mitochondrial protein-like protein [Tanacetum coccineum]
MYQLPSEPSRQEEFEDLVMNFILDQEENVRQLEEYMCVIGSDFMQLSLEVVGKLRGEIRIEQNRIKKIKKITSSPQILPSFEVYTLPVTYPDEVEEIIGIPMEVEPLEETQLEDLGLNTCNHNIPLSSREIPCFDEPEPQPNPLPNCPSLDVSLGEERGPEPPIKPHSPDSFRMKEVDHLTNHTPPSPHVASFHPKDMYCYYHPCIGDPKKHYGFKPGLLGHSGSLGVDFLNMEMIGNEWELESKEVSFLGRILNSPVRPKEVKKADVTISFKLEDLKEAEVLDTTSVDPQTLCTERGASSKGAFGPFGLLAMASKDLEEQTAIFFRVFQNQNGRYSVLMCSDLSRSTVRSNIDTTSFGAFVDIDPQYNEISLRNLIDHSIIESFGAEGKTCITSRIYPKFVNNEDAHLYAFNNGTQSVKISQMSAWKKPPLTFDELINTSIDFSAYVMHNLKIDNLTQQHLVGPTFDLLKGTCKSRVELEYHFEECYKAINDRLDWTNPEGQEYPFDLSKPLPLIEVQGRQVVPADYFINNDLEYLKGGSLSRKYTTSTTKTKVAKYDNIEGIKDMVPTLWSPVKIEVRREDQTLHNFKEGDFPNLNLRDIEDMLLLLVQKKISNLERDVIFDKKLNITRPETFRSEIPNKTPYTAYNNPQGIIYLDKLKRNRLMRSDKLYKCSDGTLTYVRTVLHDIASDLRIEYLPKRRWSERDRSRSRIMIKKIDKQLYERRLMRNLKKFVGGREYEEDFRLLERTI